MTDKQSFRTKFSAEKKLSTIETFCLPSAKHIAGNFQIIEEDPLGRWAR
jgi:hypothetical protein